MAAFPSRRFLTPILTILTLVNASNTTLSNPNDFYCGTSWPDAFDRCPLPCITGENDECSSLGSGYECFSYTGCRDKLLAQENDSNGEFAEGGDGSTNTNSSNSGASVETTADNYCGATWLDAMAACSTPCPLSGECPPGLRCFQATNCHIPLVSLRSDLIVTMLGPDRIMEGGDGSVFAEIMNDFIGSKAGEEGIMLKDVDLGEQTVDAVIGRMLRASTVHNVTQRMLPAGSSALDVSVVITGDYRPPPYLDLDSIAQDAINADADRVVTSLQERGSRAGSTFFERVEGVAAAKMGEVTERPTRAPSAKPTPGPSGRPTPSPSMEPSVASSEMPSMEPSRSLYVTLMAGSQNDLLLGGSTTSSYGYLFNMRTKADAGVVMITAFDFYTHATTEINIELWSRIGSFKDFKASTDGWDLLAKGKVTGRGIGRYTSIPEEMFTPVDIPGGGGEGGTRAFYLTMDSNNLVYKTGEGTASDSAVQMETEDIQIWEGEGVLVHPLPDPTDEMSYVYFRYPRNFLGTIYYDRMPCKPFSAYGRIDELPCPVLPTQSPTLPQPSASPTHPPPTATPVTAAPATPAPDGSTPAPINPTKSPSLTPTFSLVPSFEPSSGYPTASPIVPMRANIAVNLRNVPERPMTEREYTKFLELLLKFLTRYTSQSMAIEGIDIWHQSQIFVDAAANSTSVATQLDTSPQNRRKLLEQEKLDQILEFKKKQKEQAIPQTSAMQITLILRISFSHLPEDLLGKMAKVAIEEREMELIMMLKEQSAFYTYFKPLDGITCHVVSQLTKLPTQAPTTTAFFLSSQQNEVAEEDSGGLAFGVMVGLGVGFLWVGLTACSVLYLIRARNNMKEQHDLEDLLKQESSPMNDSSDTSHRSSIPMGTDEKSLSIDTGLSVAQKTSGLLPKHDTSKLDVVVEELAEVSSRRTSRRLPNSSFKEHQQAMSSSFKKLRDTAKSKRDKRKASASRSGDAVSTRTYNTRAKSSASRSGDVASTRTHSAKAKASASKSGDVASVRTYATKVKVSASKSGDTSVQTAATKGGRCKLHNSPDP